MAKMTAMGTTIEEDGYEYFEGVVVDNFRNRQVENMRRKGWPEAAIHRFIDAHDAKSEVKDAPDA